MMLVCDGASADFNERLTQSPSDLTPDAYLENLRRRLGGVEAVGN